MPMSPRLLRPRASGGAFGPQSIAGLQLWLDADDAATLGNTSSGAGGASNNGPVKFWGDKSGNGRNATNSGADSVCPTLLTGVFSGRNTLGFDGGDFIGGSWPLTLTQQTTFAVARTSITASQFARLFSQSDSSEDFSTSGHYIPLILSNLRDSIGSYMGGSFRGSVPVADSTPMIACSRHSGSQIINSVSGVSGTASTGLTLNKAFTSYRVGSQTPTATSFFRDRVAEVVVYNRYLSDGEKAAVERYLGAKWGVTVA